MEFRLMSDTHNEFYNEAAMFSLPYMPGDEHRVLVIAGDFTMLKHAHESAAEMTKLAKRFKAVIYVPGNHEYYGYRIDVEAANRKFDTMNPEGLDNIHFLIRDSVVIDGVRFVGATLWTNMDRGNFFIGLHLKSKMNDFRKITYYDPVRSVYQKFKPHHWEAQHKMDLRYIRETVENSSEPCVVVTHHAPSAKSLDPRFDWDHDGNFGYHSDLEDFIHEHPQITYWLHGHIHHPSDYMVGCTNVICNPYGYCGEEVEFLDKSFYNVYGYENG